MSEAGLTTGTEALRDAATKYFKETFQLSVIKINEPLGKGLSWTPSFHFYLHDHLMVAVEVSEAAYPMILSLRRVDLEKLQFPVAVYSVCPEETYLSDQKDAKRLINDGYGLLTVDKDGTVQKRASSIPILQMIYEEEFRERVKGMPQSARKRLAQCFDVYRQNAALGVSDITEAFEGLVLKAGRAAVKKAWLAAGDVNPGNSAATLKAMQVCPQLQNCVAAVGGAQGYISNWRNLSHHFPKNPAKAAKKYRECKHGFIEGIQQIKSFQEAFGHQGIKLPM